MEFTAFRRLITWQMIDQIETPGSLEQMKQWVINEMEVMEHRQRNVVRYHSFPFPTPLNWLSIYLPRLNQSVLLATAYPPVVADMSEVRDKPYRFPLTWASFVQYRVNTTIERKPLPISHPSLLSRQREEY